MLIYNFIKRVLGFSINAQLFADADDFSVIESRYNLPINTVSKKSTERLNNLGNSRRLKSMKNALF